jgi:hypothetical protein
MMTQFKRLYNFYFRVSAMIFGKQTKQESSDGGWDYACFLVILVAKKSLPSTRSLFPLRSSTLSLSWSIMNLSRTAFLTLACASLCMPIAAQTGKVDPFEEALRESVKQYRAGKIAEASTALDQARAILENTKAAQIDIALPDPPAGWEAETMKTEDVSPLLGGGNVAKKLYKNKSGQQQILLEVFYGSTLINLIRAMTENEAMAKSQGLEIKRAGGEKVLVKKLDPKNFELSMPTEDKILVRLTGKEGAEEDMLHKMMRDIDRRAIKTLIK